jgi:hypothetical protein
MMNPSERKRYPSAKSGCHHSQQLTGSHGMLMMILDNTGSSNKKSPRILRLKDLDVGVNQGNAASTAAINVKDQPPEPRLGGYHIYDDIAGT